MNLNREKIIKALECCSGTTCKVICPLSSVAEINCGQLLINESLAIIKELIEENDKLQGLISEAQQYNEAWVEDNGKLRKEMKTLKADTVRKMQEKIRAKSEYGTINISPWQLDQIAKEMLEEN